MPSKIHEILNKIKWDPRLKGRNYFIIYIHRGAPGNRKTIESNRIKNITKNFFSYEEDENHTMIPFHRILLIKDKETNEILYSKK